MSVAQVHDDDSAPKYYNVEPQLPNYKNFKKWNNNYGGVSDDDFLLQAFSHWTHEITSKVLLKKINSIEIFYPMFRRLLCCS